MYFKCDGCILDLHIIGFYSIRTLYLINLAKVPWPTKEDMGISLVCPQIKVK